MFTAVVVYLNKVIDERYSFFCEFIYTTVKLHYCVSNPWRRIVLFTISHPVAIWVLLEKKALNLRRLVLLCRQYFAIIKRKTNEKRSFC